jgi:hypothetical protein
MNDDKKKKLYILKTVGKYSFFVLCAALLTTLLVLIIEGYRFSLNGKKIEQQALVQFDSTPSGAAVSIDGQKVIGSTANKSSIDAGKHSFTISKDGYQSWNDTITVDAGTLTWLNYVRLMPTNHSVKMIKKYKTIAHSIVSPDKKNILIQSDASKPSFDVYDITNTNYNHKTFTIDSSNYSEASKDGITHTFEPIEWDSDGKYVLVKHYYDNTYEWLILNTDDNSVKNITQVLGISMDDIEFSSNSGNTLYVLSNGDLKKVDLASETISRVLVSNVKSFSSYDSNVFVYISKADSSTGYINVGVYKDGADTPVTIMTVKNPNDTVNADTAKYYDKNYLVISDNNIIKIFSGDYPTKQDDNSMSIIKTINFPETVQNISFGSNDRVVFFESNNKYGYYDVERKSYSPIDVNGSTQLSWLDDGYYLYSLIDNKLVVRDFDSSNVTTLYQTVKGQVVSLSQDEKYLYTISSNSDGFQLQRMTMIE